MNNGNVNLGFVIGAAVSASLIIMYYARKRWEVTDLTETNRNTRGSLQRCQQVRFNENLPICLICNKTIYGSNPTIQFPCYHRFHDFCVKFAASRDKCIVCYGYNEPPQPPELTSYSHVQKAPNPNIIKSNQIHRSEASSSRQYTRKENVRKLDIIYCIICNNILRDINSETTFACNHAFHKNCMKRVFKQNESPKCIICYEGPVKEIHRPRYHVDLRNKAEICIICDKVVYERAKIFGCGHIFHNRCMRFIFGADCTWTCITCVEPVSVPATNGRQKRSTGGATDEDDKDVCVICMEVLSKIRRRKLTCGHSFHNDCIEKWSAKSKICPFRCNAKN